MAHNHQRFGDASADHLLADRLDAISRQRPLSDGEVRKLRRAMNDLGERKGQRWWTADDIRRLQRYLTRGKRPAQIAPLMNRTERAIWRMMNRQGWSVGSVCNCADQPEGGA